MADAERSKEKLRRIQPAGCGGRSVAAIAFCRTSDARRYSDHRRYQQRLAALRFLPVVLRSQPGTTLLAEACGGAMDLPVMSEVQFDVTYEESGGYAAECLDENMSV